MKCEVASCPHRSSPAQQCALGEPGTASAHHAARSRRRCHSLAVASVELGRVLADRGATTLRARGYCMYPLVRPGDILHIDSRSADEIEVGDIVVCRREDYLFAHRAIAKGTHGTTSYVITRSDSSVRGSDGPTCDEDLLGIVSSIERRGKRVAPAVRRYPMPVRLYYSGRLRLLRAILALWAWLFRLLMRVQQTGWYRRARSSPATKDNERSFVVQLPLRTQTGRELAFYHSIPAGEFDVAALTWQGRKVESWRLALHLDGQRRPAAWASFVLRPPQCPSAGWWPEEMQVRIRYRGARLEEELLGKAEEILARAGHELRRRRQGREE